MTFARPTYPVSVFPTEFPHIVAGTKRFLVIVEPKYLRPGDTVEVRPLHGAPHESWLGEIVYLESHAGLAKDCCAIQVVPLGEPVPCMSA